MTLSEASNTLYKSLGLSDACSYVQAIGIADLSEYNDAEMIHVYLTRKPMAHEKSIPSVWEGYPVKTTVVGEWTFP